MAGEREREKNGEQDAERSGGIGERDGRETGALVGGTATPRRSGSL